MAVEASTSPNQTEDEQNAGEGSKKPSLMRRLGPAIPYAIGGLLLVGYFVWMCIQMSSDAPGGGAVPLSIFGAVLLGVLAGGASMISSKRGK